MPFERLDATSSHQLQPASCVLPRSLFAAIILGWTSTNTQTHEKSIFPGLGGRIMCVVWRHPSFTRFTHTHTNTRTHATQSSYIPVHAIHVPHSHQQPRSDTDKQKNREHTTAISNWHQHIYVYTMDEYRLDGGVYNRQKTTTTPIEITAL